MDKPPHRSGTRRERQDRVLDAAARLLEATPSTEFSMRDLAREADVSFATPFNYFGSKMAIMHALSARLIDTMGRRLHAASAGGDTPTRLLAAVEIAVGVLLENPDVSRRIIGTLGSPTSEAGQVFAHSRGLWASALGDLAGIREDMQEIARLDLPDLLAIGFRGCISFWAAGEIEDSALHGRANAITSALLLGFVEPGFIARLTLPATRASSS